MTSAHEYFTTFCDSDGKLLYQIRQHAMIETQWDWGKIMELPENTLIYNWGYVKEDEPWEDTDFIEINQFLIRSDFFKYILKDMDVPTNRTADMKWLRRNLGIYNSTHPNYPRLMRILDEYVPY